MIERATNSADPENNPRNTPSTRYRRVQMRYHNNPMNPRHKQRSQGVALITAMLIVALASIAAVAVVSRQQFDIRRSANLINGDQAYQFALGVESWAKQLLVRDLTKGATDDLKEDWAKQLPPLSVEGGQVAGHIEDLQSRYNLNNLVDNAGVINNNEVERFKNLLRSLNIPDNLAYAVADWIDTDINPDINGGAEDTVYTGLQPAYRTANTLMRSVSELRLVDGITPKFYAQLEPLVCALPAVTKINVNTATAEVLVTLSSALSMSAAQLLVDARKTKPFADTAAFESALTSIGGLTANDVTAIKNQGGWAVSSSYFLVTADTLFGKGRVHLYSELKRATSGQPGTASQASVIYRVQGVL